MAGSVNKVILVGNLGRDPEVRTTNNGQKVVSFSIATSESWRDRNSGDRQERTEWHRVVIFAGGGQGDGLAGVAEKYLRKGSKVYVEGELRTRKWQGQDGQDRYTTEVVLSGPRAVMTMLDGRGEGGGSDSRSGGGDRQREATGGGDQAPAWDSGGRDLDDEIPF